MAAPMRTSATKAVRRATVNGLVGAPDATTGARWVLVPSTARGTDVVGAAVAAVVGTGA